MVLIKGIKIIIKALAFEILYTDLRTKVYSHIIQMNMNISVIDATIYPTSNIFFKRFNGAKNMYGTGANALKNRSLLKFPFLSKIFATYSKNNAEKNHQNMLVIILNKKLIINVQWNIVLFIIPADMVLIAVIHIISTIANLIEICMSFLSKKAFGEKITLYMYSKKSLDVIPINITAFCLK